MTAIYWRSFIGPRYEPDKAASAQYDWTQLTSGDTSHGSIGFQYTLVSIVGSTIVLNGISSTPAISAVGGIWLGPNGDGEDWEYVTYTGATTGSGQTTLTGVVREPTLNREHNGVHTVGALCHVFFPLVADTGELMIGMEATDDESAIFWRAEAAGMAGPKSIFKPNHLFLVQIRYDHTASFQDFLVGWIRQASLSDNNERGATYELEIQSSGGLLAKQVMSAYHIGIFELARSSQIEVSSTLTRGYKDEATYGEFAADRMFDTTQATDGNLGTNWIADGVVGVAGDASHLYRGFSQIFFNLRPDQERGQSFIEMRSVEGGENTIWIYCNDTTYVYADAIGVDIGDRTGWNATDARIVFAQSGDVFSEIYSRAQPTALVDFSLRSESESLFDVLSGENGVIAIRNFLADGYIYYIAWGDTYGVSTFTPPGWEAPPTTAVYIPDPIPTGYGIRYNYWTGQHVIRSKFWPGEVIRDDGDDEWMLLRPPSMGLVSRDDVDNASTADVYIVDGTGVATTDGLPESGTVFIGAARVNYSGKESDRLTGATVSEANIIQGGIVQVEWTVVQGANTYYHRSDAYPIRQISLWAAEGTNWIERFNLRISAQIARSPNESRHEYDYSDNMSALPHINTPDAEPVVFTYGSTEYPRGFRPRAVLFEFKRWHALPTRPRVNEINLVADERFWRPGAWFEVDHPTTDPTDTQIIAALVGKMNFPATAILSVETSTRERVGFTTDYGRAWEVIADACDFLACRLMVNLDSKISVTIDHMARGDTITPTNSWGRNDVAELELHHMANDEFRRVRLEWIDAAGAVGGEVFYPAIGGVLTPDTGMADTLDLGSKTYYSEAEALAAARKAYFIARYPYQVVARLIDVVPNITRPGLVDSVAWDWGVDNGDVARNVFVERVDITISENIANVVFSGLQVDRENP